VYSGREGTNKAIYYVYISTFTQIFFIKCDVNLMIRYTSSRSEKNGRQKQRRIM